MPRQPAGPMRARALSSAEKEIALYKRRRRAWIRENKNLLAKLYAEPFKPISKMSRAKLLGELRTMRDLWENITFRNQDLRDEHLATCDDRALRQTLEWYYSQDAHALIVPYLVEMIQDCVK